jgi:hypothetical protein
LVKAQILLAVILLGATSAFPQGFRSELPARHAAASRRFYPGGFPWLFGDYGYGYDGYAPAPSVVMVQQPPLYVLMPPAPSEPPRPEIHEYQSAAPTANEDQAFAIVLRDGSVHSAVAVTVQKGTLYYVEPDGAHRLVAVDALDREATQRLNRERKLQLQLPPAQ